MRQRSIGKMVFLSIITLGIYQLLWLYETKEEMNAKGNDVPPIKLLLAPILAFVGVAVLQFIFRFVSAQTANGGGNVVINLLSLLVGVVAVVVILPLAIYWYYKYCVAVENVTNKELTWGASLAILAAFTFFGVSFIWPFVVQYFFNKTSNGQLPAPGNPAGVEA